jgi:outer membrane protein, heavy metal efflux system
MRTAFIADLKGLFHKILLIQEEIELAEKNAAALEETQMLIERRARLGELKELEGIKLRVEALKARNELARLRTDLELAREDLNRNLGNSLPPEFALRGKLECVLPAIEEKALVEKALQSHPLIQQKEAEQDLSESRWSYVRWQRFPDLKLSGFLNNELDGKIKGVGISLEIPLWNFRTKEIVEARNLFEKKRTELAALKLEVGADVRSRISRLRLSERTIALFEGELLRQADMSLRISEVSYREGEISLVEYLDSQRTHYAVMKDYRSSLYQWALDKFALEKSVGAELN